MPEARFDAFISYRRSDGSQVAHWLRRELQAFRVPKALRERFGNPLKVYLDTAYERGTSDFYEQTIRPALLSSRWLLVVATPDARLRPQGVEDWIQREVADFSKGPHRGNVIAVRGAGEFDDPLPADLIQRFPRIEIVDLRGASRFSFFNPVRAARHSSEKLKLIAPLLEIPAEEMPRLRQEEERRQQTRLGGAAGATLGVVTAVSALSVFALQSRFQATRALEDSMFATGSMVLQSAGIEEGRSAKTDRTRRLLMSQGCDLIDKLSESSGRDPGVSEAVTCRLERALAREKQNEPDLSRAELRVAIATAKVAFDRSKRLDAAERLLESVDALAEFEARQKRPDDALAGFQLLRDEARRVQQERPKQAKLIRMEGEALGRIGDLLQSRGAKAEARTAFLDAAGAVGRSLEWRGDRKPMEDVEWHGRLYRLAGAQSLELGAPAVGVEQLRQALAALDTIEASSMPASMIQEAATIQGHIFDAERKRGQKGAAAAARTASLAACDRVASNRNASAELKRRAAALKDWLEKQSIE